MPRLSAQFLVLFVAVLLANSALSCTWTRNTKSASVAGAFYALVAFAAARHAIERMREPGGSDAAGRSVRGARRRSPRYGRSEAWEYTT